MEDSSGEKATEDLYGSCPNVKVTIGDVEIDQHFFLQDWASHPVILGWRPRCSIMEEPSRESRALTIKDLFNSLRCELIMKGTGREVNPRIFRADY